MAEHEFAIAPHDFDRALAGGEGVQKDEVEMFLWGSTRQPAEHGSAEAPHNTGLNYFEDRGV